MKVHHIPPTNTRETRNELGNCNENRNKFSIDEQFYNHASEVK